jgi:hypothetical protein
MRILAVIRVRKCSVGRHMHLLGRRDAKLGLAREKIFRLDVPIEVNFHG